MRITQRAVTLTSLQGLNRNLESLGKLQNQLTSGRLINAPSDSPTGTNKAMQTRSDQAAVEQFGRNIADADSWLSITDSTLQNMLDVTRRVQFLTTQGASTAPPMQSSATSAESTATGERLKDHQRSLSKKRETVAATAQAPRAEAPPPRSTRKRGSTA